MSLDIDPADPLLHFLQTAPGPVEVDALPAYSPAVRAMKADGIVVVVPLIASGELVGMLALGPRRSERPYGRDDRRLLDQLARYAAPALRVGQLVRQQQEEARNRERIESELAVAQLIQQQFLPHDLPEPAGWTIATCYRPARTVGGDFYDVVPLTDGRVMVVAGDVTDKGVPAALVMASTQALLRSTAAADVSPGAVLERVNDLLYPQIPVHMFVTCLVLIVDPGTGQATFANAGHNLPFVRSEGREGPAVRELDARGMPLGLMAGSRYEEHRTQLAEGDLLLLYSDGITEQHDAVGQMFGFARTEAVVAGASGVDDVISSCMSTLAAFQGDVEQEDDITLLALQRHPSSPSRPDPDARSLRFAVASVAGNERPAMERVLQAVRGTLPEDRLQALGTAVAETVMNAIEHGNAERADLMVDLDVQVTPAAVVVAVTDHGGGSPAGSRETPDIDLKLAGVQSARGWGLFLVERLVDGVEEQDTPPGHTVLLRMQRSDAEAEERTP